MAAKSHKLYHIAAGFGMNLKKIIIGMAVLILSQTSLGFAEDETISEEDIQVIQMLEILENLDLLEEDLDLLESMSEIGEDDDS